MMSSSDGPVRLIAIAAEIVAAYVATHSVQPQDLARIIADVHRALETAVKGESEPESLKPAVPVQNSVTPHHLVCLEDGKTYKSLKRHLRLNHDMTPAQYRERWRLPTDYPMVAPNYGSARSDLAKGMGLGQKRRKSIEAEPPLKTTRRGKPRTAKASTPSSEGAG